MSLTGSSAESCNADSPSVRRIEEGEQPCNATVTLVASGRGSLSFVVGNASQRYQLFQQNIQWQKIVVAYDGQQPIGFAAWQRFGRGPYMPTLRDFVRVFGWRSGWWRSLLFWGIEMRTLFQPCYLYGLKVEPAARRRGVAEALVQAVEAQAKALGASNVTLEVKVGNVAAIGLYKKSGYDFVKLRGTGLIARWCALTPVQLLKKTI